LSVAFLIAISSGGCTVIPQRFAQSEPALPAPSPEPFVATNEPVVLARKHFERGEYGLSERYFRQAVEQNPQDADSWIGLAASYDNLKRFELADRAYGRAFHLSGPTLPLLNDMGYSYMLRGDSRRARAAFKKALSIDPTNLTVLNNLRILGGAAAPLPAPHAK
jgi:Flp pilus assembly protein TadD